MDTEAKFERSPENVANELIGVLGFDAAEAHAELCAVRARHFDMVEEDRFWTTVADIVRNLFVKRV